MSILDDNSASNINSGLNVTGSMKRNWITTAKWAMFFAILGFVYIAFTLSSLGSTSTSLQALSMAMGSSPMLSVMYTLVPYMTVISIVVMAATFFINFFHLRFSLRIQKAINQNDQGLFVSAWLNFRNYMRFLGIFVSAIIALYFILLLFIGYFFASVGTGGAEY